MLMKITGVLCIAAIGAIVGAFFFAPGLLHNRSGLGLLIFAICPISMALMMWTMSKADKAQTPPQAGAPVARARHDEMP